MRKFIFFILLVSFLPYSYGQANISVPEAKDNFSLYLMGVQSELLGDVQSAFQCYNISSYTSDNKIYFPSSLRNLNLRLASGDYGLDTKKLLDKLEPLITDSLLLNNLKIDYFMGKHDYQSAEKLCSQILLSDPNNSKIAQISAIIDFSKDSLSCALSKINNYEINYGIDYQLYSIKREILARNNLYDSLLSYNNRVYDLFPENLSILSDLANVHTAMGNDSSAYDIWNTILHEDPNSLEYLYQSNLFYSSRQFPDETISTSLKLLSSPIIVAKAKEDIFHNIFISFDINKDTTHLKVLDSLLFDVAVQEYDTVVVQEMALSYYYFRKDYDHSLKLLDTMISRPGSSMTPFLQKANLLNTLGRFNEALDLLDHGATVFPHVPNFTLYKAELIKENISHTKAIQCVRQAIKSETVDTTQSHYLSYIADIIFKQGKQSAAFNLYKKSLSLYPDNASTLNNYAYFLAISDGNLEKALVMSHKCNSLVKNNPTYLDTEAYILYRLGLYSEAKQLMDLAFSSESDTEDFSAELYLHYADILMALGNNILAKNYFNKSLEAGGDRNYIQERLKLIE